jgi:hypothetical protein
MQIIMYKKRNTFSTVSTITDKQQTFWAHSLSEYHVCTQLDVLVHISDGPTFIYTHPPLFNRLLTSILVRLQLSSYLQMSLAKFLPM